MKKILAVLLTLSTLSTSVFAVTQADIDDQVSALNKGINEEYAKVLRAHHVNCDRATNSELRENGRYIYVECFSRVVENNKHITERNIYRMELIESSGKWIIKEV
ncbi:hypothetical protein V4836_08130 [Kluyvera ascorbata]|uniref:DUF3828 domain-containing protein n=1 Tax=Kluyvera ascorbata TaxID=51288 RepID=A0AB35X7S0_9ENTR